MTICITVYDSFRYKRSFFLITSYILKFHCRRSQFQKHTIIVHIHINFVCMEKRSPSFAIVSNPLRSNENRISLRSFVV